MKSWLQRLMLVAGCFALAQGAGAAGKAKHTVRVRSLGLHQPFIFGGVRYQVDSFVGWPSFDLGTNMYPNEYNPPQGSIFIVVHYRVEDVTTDPIQLPTNRFYVYDRQGRRFSVSTETQVALAMHGGFVGGHVSLYGSTELQPGVARTLVAAFVVPADEMDQAARIVFLSDGRKEDLIDVVPLENRQERVMNEAAPW